MAFLVDGRLATIGSLTDVLKQFEIGHEVNLRVAPSDWQTVHRAMKVRLFVPHIRTCTNGRMHAHAHTHIFSDTSAFQERFPASNLVEYSRLSMSLTYVIPHMQLGGKVRRVSVIRSLL